MSGSSNRARVIRCGRDGGSQYHGMRVSHCGMRPQEELTDCVLRKEQDIVAYDKFS